MSFAYGLAFALPGSATSLGMASKPICSFESTPHPDPLPDRGGEGMASRRRPGTPAVNGWRAFAPPRVSQVHQRIARLEFRKRGEIPVRCPEFAHAVVEAESGDAGVVNARAGESGSQCQVAKFFEIPGAFRKDVQTAA